MKKTINVLLLIIGIALLTYGYLEYDKYTKEHQSYKLIEALVDAVEPVSDNNNLVTFTYTIDNKEYTNSIYTNENLEVDGTKNIYYDTYNPDNIKLTLSTVYKSLGIIISGIILFLIGLIITIKRLSYKLRIKSLKEKGTLINASIQEVVVVPKKNNKNPYMIRAIYLNPPDNKTYFFESEETYTNLKEIVSRKNIITIPVYISNKNNKDYYVDIDSL